MRSFKFTFLASLFLAAAISAQEPVPAPPKPAPPAPAPMPKQDTPVKADEPAKSDAAEADAAEQETKVEAELQPAEDTKLTKPSVVPRNIEALRARFGVEAFDKVPTVAARLKTIKVAVLDNGFGARNTLKADLPSEVFRLIDTYPADFNTRHGYSQNVNPLDNTDNHGRQVAQLVWAMTGLKKETAPQMLLMNANGFTNLRRAIDMAIEEKVDIIVYSINWEYGGNFDGRGFINAAVSKATKAGILWVNAAGNQANKVYNAPVVLDDSQHVKLASKGLRVKSRFDRTPVKITLTWNSYAEDESTGTDKDLDLFLMDSDGNVVAKSESNQRKGTEPKREGKDDTYIAREIIETDLAATKKGKEYRLKVYAKNRNFTTADKLRITVFSNKAAQYDADEKGLVEAVELLDNTPRQETMIPADHPEVIAVGDMTPASSRGPTMDGRAKPDVILRYSDSEFTDGDGIAGTSYAAAFFAGILAMTKAYVPHLDRDLVMAQVKQTTRSDAYRPGESMGIENLGVEVVRKEFPDMFRAIEDLIGDKDNKNPIVLAGKYKKTGQYVIRLNTTPLLFGKYFRHFPAVTENPAHYEVFVAKVQDEGKPALWAYVRDRAKGEDETEEWQKLLKKRPDLFLEVGAARPAPKLDKNTKIPLWDNPPITVWTAKK